MNLYPVVAPSNVLRGCPDFNPHQPPQMNASARQDGDRAHAGVMTKPLLDAPGEKEKDKLGGPAKVLDLSQRRCEEAFVLVARSRSGTIDRPLLEAMLQMLGLKLTTADLDGVLMARYGAGEQSLDDTYDMVESLNVVDAIRAGKGLSTFKMPPHTTRHLGSTAWARVDPMLLLPIARVNGRLLRTQTRQAALPGADTVDKPSGSKGGDHAGASHQTVTDTMSAHVEPLPPVTELNEDELTRLHMQQLLHTYSNKPFNAADTLVRIYAQVCVGALCMLARVVYGARDSCGRPLGIYILVYGVLVLSSAGLQLLGATVTANRTPLQLMHMPLETGLLEFAIDGVRIMLVLPVLAIWTLVGTVWIFSFDGAQSAEGVICLRDRRSVELWYAAIAVLAVTLFHALTTVAFIVCRAGMQARRRERVRDHAPDHDEEQQSGDAQDASAPLR